MLLLLAFSEHTHDTRRQNVPYFISTERKHLCNTLYFVMACLLMSACLVLTCIHTSVIMLLFRSRSLSDLPRSVEK